jgi:hypothetical protein
VTKKQRKYLNRLQERYDVLKYRLDTTQLLHKDPILMEMHALEWAIVELKKLLDKT